MYPILFQFGPITIYSFGVFMALAALTAAWVVSSELKRRGYNAELASTMVFAAAIGGLVGARLLFIVEEWNNFLAAPWNYIFTGAAISTATSHGILFFFATHEAAAAPPKKPPYHVKPAKKNKIP